MTEPIPFGQIPQVLLDRACTLDGLTATKLNGGQVNLDMCDWVLTSPCGCVRGLTLAYSGPAHLIPTEEKAWKQFVSRKADREAAATQGCRMFLLDHDDLRAVPMEFLAGPCPHSKEG